MEEPQQLTPKKVPHRSRSAKTGPKKHALKTRAYILNVYSVIAIVAAAAFGALHILAEGNPLVGELELGCSLVLLINMVALRFHRNIAVARTILLLVLMALMMVLLISGGTQNTGIFWLFIFPIVAYFLAGKAQGFWWVGSFYLLIMITALVAHLTTLDIPYPLISIRQLVISLIVVGIGVYIFQSEREAALKDLEDSQRDLQEYLDQMPSYNLKVGVDGRVLFANKAAKAASGLGERLLGTKFLEGGAWTANPEAKKQTEAAFYEAVTGKSPTYDTQIKVASGAEYRTQILRFSLVPIFENQRIKYVLVEAREVTTEREVEHTKNEFVGIATGQLRPSIAAISTATEKLRASLPERLTDEQHTNLQQIFQNNLHIGTVVGNMLLVSGLELGTLPVRPKNTSLAILCESVLEQARLSSLKNRSLSIDEDYAADVPEAIVDPELMETVLRNLISNAIKFTPDGGHITIRLSKGDQILAAGSKGTIQVEVQDSGRGMSESDQQKVFTKFFRAQTVSQETTGSGLGLYIVKKLLDYVGGTITFTSKENVGTIFIVSLPIEGMRPHTPPSS